MSSTKANVELGARPESTAFHFVVHMKHHFWIHFCARRLFNSVTRESLQARLSLLCLPTSAEAAAHPTAMSQASSLDPMRPAVLVSICCKVVNWRRLHARGFPGVDLLWSPFVLLLHGPLMRVQAMKAGKRNNRPRHRVVHGLGLISSACTFPDRLDPKDVASTAITSLRDLFVAVCEESIVEALAAACTFFDGFSLANCWPHDLARLQTACLQP